MPHKHTRKEVDKTHSPPTETAKPLSVGPTRTPKQKGGAPQQNPSANAAPNRRNKRKAGRTIHDGYGEDDTPKAFLRLMQFQTRGKGLKGLDDGKREPKKKKQKIEKPEELPTDTVNSEAQPQTQEVLKIQPGEKLNDFAQRVNQAMPLAGAQKKGKKIEGVKDHRVTKHEKKLLRLQKGWREEEARIQEKEQEERELAEEEQDEYDAMWEDKTVDLPVEGAKKGKKKKKANKRKKVVGEVEVDDDPWEALQAKRVQQKGLHDVVQEPPTFTKIPREIFKVKSGAKVHVADIPNAAGSLRRREELGAARQGIIETYRRIVEERRNNQEQRGNSPNSD